MGQRLQEPEEEDGRQLGEALLQPAGPSTKSWQCWGSELKLLLNLAGPVVVVGVLLLAIQLSSVMFVGHLDELSLARATIATSFANVVGVSVVQGMATALDTFCGQAYGAEEYHRVGFYLQQGLVGLNLSAIPFAVLFVFVGSILQALQQDSDIAVGAGYYTRCLIPALFGVATSQPLVRFLLAQSLVIPVLLCAFATFLCHLLACWILVYKTGLGFQGAGVATSISYWIFALLLAAYVKFSKACEICRVSWSWNVFRDLKAFFQLAIPSGAMICLEWWCYELLVIIAGLLPNPELQASAVSVCLNTSATLFQIPFGIGVAASTRVSNELGRRNIQRARNAIKLAIGIAVLEALTFSIILLCLHNVVGKLFSSDSEVIAYVSKIIWMLSVNIFFDALQATLSGVARGCGLQKYGALINLGSYYCVGLPIGCVLAFRTSLQGQGLWVTALCAPVVQASSLTLLISFANWEKLVQEAAARMRSEQEESLLLGSEHQEAQ